MNILLKEANKVQPSLKNIKRQISNVKGGYKM